MRSISHNVGQLEPPPEFYAPTGTKSSDAGNYPVDEGYLKKGAMQTWSRLPNATAFSAASTQHGLS